MVAFRYLVIVITALALAGCGGSRSSGNNSINANTNARNTSHIITNIQAKNLLRSALHGNNISLHKLKVYAHDRNKYAEMWLGQYYFLRRDYDETYYWYRKSARQGDSYAYLGLFDLYSHGQGVTQNMGKAEQWLKRGMLASEHSTG